ncbi:MAG: AlkZ-related protein [Candidatus Asgardarchaeia archaeon]
MSFLRGKMAITDTIQTVEDALEFVNKYGCVTLFPLKRLEFPNLFSAIKGTTEYKFSKAWLFADTLALDKKIHYVKYISNKITLISLDLLPCFYNLFGRDFKPTSPIQIAILNHLSEEGITSTKALRKELQITSVYESKEFSKAIGILWSNFKIAVAGKTEEPIIVYWDLIERWYDRDVLNNDNCNADKKQLIDNIITRVTEKINWISKTKLKTLLRLY